MQKKAIVFTDLDGTLLDHYTYQTDAADETITTLKFNNIPIIPNSSKTQQEILLIRKQLNLNSPFIIENGAAVYIPVNYFKVPPQDTHLENGFWVKSFTQPKEHWLSLLKQHAQHFQNDFQGFSQLSDTQLSALTGLSIDKAAMAKMRQYSEPLNWLGSAQSQVEFTQKMRALGANILQGGRFLHVSGNCDKGQAQRWLSEQYQKEHPQKEIITIALGDSKNDNAMLEEATIAIQIHSPVHDFPRLKREHQVYQSRQDGPAGWAESLHKILLSPLINKL
ncbi:HAD-IIB family hydrolase [Psychromonas antarctica]|uniref:HAD-IIB family hydrolase n=1 Tax=Psychromonas antarctica TaxID=67573 RepID=UPI001EE7EB17|nr:HAD-IIB family hydrolase [Psychromonas antarctica]MCG6199646.1 HAD-IIB family hydrolase [Psychromonas antarctica]